MFNAHDSPANRRRLGSLSAASAGYAGKRERERARNAAASRSGRDIGPIPPPADPPRREKAETDAEFFYRAYFPHRFPLPFSRDHLTIIAALERSMRQGGLQAFAMPRGSGKTSLCEAAAVRAHLLGLRRCIVIVGASGEAAHENLASIKSEYEGNELLAADFPEVCRPIQKLDGIANRQKGQLCGGRRTEINWSRNWIRLPIVAGSRASGAILCVRGITGRVRGIKYKGPAGEQIRPDLVIIDDFQTDASARSASQIKKRLETVTSAILGLAGPGQKIAAFCPCTKIAAGDAADQLLNRDLHPDWHGQIMRLLDRLPVRDDLWAQYADLRRNDLRQGGSGAAATEFYRKNRPAMDEGGAASWAERYNPDELSAIQHAMNWKIDRPAAFAAEAQNEPLTLAAGEDEPLDPQLLSRKVSGLPRGRVPLAAQKITAFVDVQKRALFWAACAWAEDFTGQVLDYGVFPDQGSRYFSLAALGRSLQDARPGGDLAGQLRAGLDCLIGQLAARHWAREDGALLPLTRILIDSGFETEAIYQFSRETAATAIVLPSKGWGITAAKPPMSEWKKRPGDQVGQHWFVSRVENHRSIRLVSYDANHWKTHVRRALAEPHGSRGGLSLYGAAGEDHQLLAEHCTAETAVRTEGRGRTVYAWQIKPDRRDNHWWDCLVGCAVAASLEGISLPSAAAAAIAPPPKLKLRELYERKRQRR